MLELTRKIEESMISKLNCMYFVGKRVSLPNIDCLNKQIKEDSKRKDGGVLKATSKRLNELINDYFKIEDECKIQHSVHVLDEMELTLAGDEELRNQMMPLLYIDSSREQASINVREKQGLLVDRVTLS